MSRSRKFSYNPDDAPADVAQAFGVPDEVCRRIAADHRKAALFDRLPLLADACGDVDTLKRVLAALVAG